MKKQVLAEILGQRASTGEENDRFLYELQLSVLAALKECGSLTELQFSYGADMLKGQHRAALRNLAQNAVKQET